ncbi:MAG: DUF429 domain-containing protein [Anaerolineales bacterium]
MYAGIDPGGREKTFTLAILDENLRPQVLCEAEGDEVLAFVANWEEGAMAIQAPATVARGRARQRERGQRINQRLAEYELRQRGFPIANTPADERLCPAWMQSGFDLYRRLQAAGWQTYPQHGKRLLIESNPLVGFWSLLGQPPMPRQSLEGRLQRQLVLYDCGLQVRDPMLFFEEITRHRLRKGRLPWEWVYTPSELDALLAAYTAYLVKQHPQQTWQVGDEEEGVIVLPGMVQSATSEATHAER